jgi:hypothetical protein
MKKTDAGTQNDVRLQHPEKDDFSIRASCETGSKTTIVSDEHPSKHRGPITLMDAGIRIEHKFPQYAQAVSASSVNGDSGTDPKVSILNSGTDPKSPLGRTATEVGMQIEEITGRMKGPLTRWGRALASKATALMNP